MKHPQCRINSVTKVVSISRDENTAVIVVIFTENGRRVSKTIHVKKSGYHWAGPDGSIYRIDQDEARKFREEVERQRQERLEQQERLKQSKLLKPSKPKKAA